MASRSNGSLKAVIRAIEYYLPEDVLDNRQLVAEFPEWTEAKIEEKTGISKRRIAREDQCSSDLGVSAAEKLFAGNVCEPRDIDYILFCTQSPDYFLPTTACLVQHRLGVPRTCGALDFNLGCSGFVYGLSLAKGLIETGQARNILLITAETYSKYIHPSDRSVRTIFGDGAAATLIQGIEQEETDFSPWIGPFVFGTDGCGAENLIVKKGGMRGKGSLSSPSSSCAAGENRGEDYLYMNGSKIFAFTLRVVPRSVEDLLSRAGLSFQDIRLFVFHQANQYMLEHLRKKMGIPEERFLVSMQDWGNTVSASIPIALRSAQATGTLRQGDLLTLVGFGVGYSWASAIVRWFG